MPTEAAQTIKTENQHLEKKLQEQGAEIETLNDKLEETSRGIVKCRCSACQLDFENEVQEVRCKIWVMQP